MPTVREIVANRFEIRGAIGHGGMGTVYMARDLRDDSIVALKTLHQVAPSALLRLKDEFRALADVLHPNLVRLHELFVDPERDDVFGCFFSMEYVPGRHVLDQLCRRPEHPVASATWSGDAPPEGLVSTLDLPVRAVTVSLPGRSTAVVDPTELAHTFAQIGSAVDALHRGGKLHRDLKSANVLLGPDGRAVVLDFGLVQPTGAENDSAAQIAGTPGAMAPEQMRGEPAGPAADWYAVGVLLYEALSGQPPFDGDFDALLAAKLLRQVRPLPAGADPAWAQLCYALLEPDPARRAGYAELQQVLAPQQGARKERRVTPRDPLVGRFAERSVLRDAWARACAGDPVTVFVRGRSGIGKSVLVRELIQHVSGNPANLVLTGRCHEREQIPHKALDAVIDSLSQHLLRLPVEEVLPLVPEHAGALARLFPVLARHPAFTSGEPVPADPRAVRTLGAVALEDLLHRLTARWHVLIAIEDLQWGDSDSAALITRFLRSPRPPALMLLGSHREEDEATSPMLLELLALRGPGPDDAHPARIEDLRLGPLSETDARQLLRSSGVDVDETVLGEAAGDPYLLAEASMWMPTAGTVRFSGIPEMLSARLESIPESVRGLVEAVAIVGRPIPLTLLPAAHGDLRGDLRIATQQRLLRLRGEASEERVDCYHDQVRATALGGLSAARRRVLHGELAEALELASPPDAEALSIHHEGAGDTERAAIWALRGAESAESALAFRHAAALYKRYLALAGPGAVRGEAEVRLAENLANSGDGRAAAEAFLEAASSQPENGVILRTRAVHGLLMSGHLDAGLRLASSLLAEVGLDFHGSQARAAVTTAWRRLRLRLRGTEPSKIVADANELQRLDVCWAMVTGLHSVDPIRSSAFQAQYMLLALDAGEPGRIARGFAAEAASMSIGGERKLAGALAIARQAQMIAEQLDDPHLLALTAQERGTVYFMCGHWREAEVEFKAALALLAAHCPGAVWERSTSELFLMDQYIYLGEIDRIADAADRLLRDGTATGNLYQLTIALRPLHMVRLAADDPERAFREVTAAIRGWPGEGRVQHFNASWALAQTELYAGRPEEALQRIEALWPVLGRTLLLTMEYVRIEARHARARALLASATGKNMRPRLAAAESDAKDLLHEAAPWARPLGLLVRAGVRGARGERPTDDLTEALALFEAQGMALYAAAARRRLAELLGDANAVHAAFSGLKVVHPGRMTGMLAPGFPRAAALDLAPPKRLVVAVGRALPEEWERDRPAT